jgi:hypothetical protein
MESSFAASHAAGRVNSTMTYRFNSAGVSSNMSPPMPDCVQHRPVWLSTIDMRPSAEGCRAYRPLARMAASRSKKIHKKNANTAIISSNVRSPICRGIFIPRFYPPGGPFSRRDFRRRMDHSTASVAAIESGPAQAIRLTISGPVGGRLSVTVSGALLIWFP